MFFLTTSKKKYENGQTYPSFEINQFRHRIFNTLNERMIMANLKQRLNRRNSRTSYTLFIEKKNKIPELKTEKNHKMYNIFDKVNKSGLNVKKHKNLGDVLYSGYKRSDFIKRKK